MMRLDWMNRPLACAAVLLAMAGCKKEPTPAAKAAPAADAPEAAPAAGLPAAATSATLPALVTVTAEPAEAPPTQQPRVSVDMRSGPELTAGLPTVGEAASFRMTLRDADGQFVSNLDPLFGGKLLFVVARADLGWTTVLRADEMSDKVRGTHDFRMIFPFAGIYRTWFLFSYGGKTYSEEMAFSVEGKPFVGKELPESTVQWQDDKGMAARLKIEPAAPQTCQPFQLATAWTRKDKPLRMSAEPDAPTTWYIAIEGGLGEIVTSAQEKQPVDPPKGATESVANKMGGDLGTLAALKVTRPGRYRVLAIATPPGAKAGQKDATVVASFAITVQGEKHEGGCPK